MPITGNGLAGSGVTPGGGLGQFQTPGGLGGTSNAPQVAGVNYAPWAMPSNPSAGQSQGSPTPSNGSGGGGSPANYSQGNQLASAANPTGATSFTSGGISQTYIPGQGWTETGGAGGVAPASVPGPNGGAPAPVDTSGVTAAINGLAGANLPAYQGASPAPTLSIAPQAPATQTIQFPSVLPPAQGPSLRQGLGNRLYPTLDNALQGLKNAY